ncbi:hypothetical protein HY339_01905 [Candidatus Gottesmanbacteria bacterium]|nr:hypothetical protein [Candidatus Gottesmanbacteria bacterium]
MFIFPYQTKRIDEGKIFVPVVTVELETIKGFWPFEMLLDSGADVTTFPLTPLASYFPNFKKDPKNKIVIGGVEGRGVFAYPHSVHTKLGNKYFLLRCYFIESNVDPLLGRLDFWNLFSVSFDNQKGRTEIIPTVPPGQQGVER